MNKESIKQQIAENIKRVPHYDRILRLALFGSHLYDTASDKSDIDILVEFSRPLGFIGQAQMKQELENILNKKVDLVTPRALSKYFRDDVVKEAETLYDIAG